MHSFLIVSKNRQQRDLQAFRLAEGLLSQKIAPSTPPSDLLVLSINNKSSIGIENVRRIGEFLKNKPWQANAKVVIVPESQLLTLEAQNALLKTLEEPPGHSYIILTSPHEGLLLPTVVSRCALRRISHQTKPDDLENHEADNLTLLLKGGYRERLDFMEKNEELFSKKEKNLEIIDDWLVKLYQISQEKIEIPALREVEKILLEAKKNLLVSHVSARSLIELCLLKIPEKIKI